MEYQLTDNSNDRKYFTIIPNYVLNHSSAIDQALYLQMKRAAGEDGVCFITQKHMCERLGIGKDKLRTSLKYLTEHKWIEFVGTTESRTRPINTYKINDIWDLNVDYYQKKKISPKSALSLKAKDKTQKTGDKTQIRHKIRPETDPLRRTNIKEELIKKNTRKPYSSLKDITEKEFTEVALYYGLPISFVKSCYENLVNYCEAKGKIYKNYLAALRNFVKGDAEKKGIKLHSMPIQVKSEEKKEPFIPVSFEKLARIKKEAYQKIGKIVNEKSKL